MSPVRKIDKAEAIRMRKEGTTIAAIAARFGVAKQSAYRVVGDVPLPPIPCTWCGDDFYPTTEANHFCSNRCYSAVSYRRQTPEQGYARKVVQRAITRGTLTRSDSCERCGASGVRIEGHHADYSKQLEVEWLCVTCHRRHHASLTEPKAKAA